ncbi:hypothetical protein [Sphingomonas sp. S6]|uniref:hypothetical protein n=1 Tax=Sphingomonas sp. S6 TaxID=3368600 RepID=UPI000FAB2B21|nr:hypothetical protein [uncultured Sphingomonas sp.]RTL15538.1 MAG: hypothetical protein EKK50_12930 [Sphingomonadaceae bacterium]
MRNEDDDAWFAAKRFGYGAGLPIAWQGWAVLVAYLAVVIGMSRLWPHAAAFVVIPATIAVVWVAHAKTRGGWKWRGWR